MSDVIKAKGLTAARAVTPVSVILVILLINVASPIVSRVYARVFRGQPVILLTEFVIDTLPVALLPFALMLLFFSRLRSCVARSACLFFFLVVICVLYLIGLVLPFVCYPIGLEQ